MLSDLASAFTLMRRSSSRCSTIWAGVICQHRLSHFEINEKTCDKMPADQSGGVYKYLSEKDLAGK